MPLEINQMFATPRSIAWLWCREGWPGWDTVQAHMPEAEVQNLIIELRSATAGVGTYTYEHDHMSELTGREADQIVEAAKAAEAA